MIKKWNQYNEDAGWPWKKKEQESDLTKNLGASRTVYPESQLRVVSDVTVDEPKINPLVDDKIDKLFIQEISNRLYGPDSVEYVKALKELNAKFKSADVLVGSQLRNKESEQREILRSEAERTLADRYGRTNP